MGGRSSKKPPPREEVWAENKLAEEEPGWGGITSYNLLDLQVTQSCYIRISP